MLVLAMCGYPFLEKHADLKRSFRDAVIVSETPPAMPDFLSFLAGQLSTATPVV